MKPAISVRKLKKSYGEKAVLQGIDFDVAPGTVFGYVGPNGAGKTTTVRILTALLDDFEGQATVAGFDPRLQSMEVKRKIGYVPENLRLYETLTAFEYLQLVARLRALDEKRIPAKIEALMDAFELTDRIHGRLSGFSKGMRQKVMISAALMHDPDVLFLDEPLSGLDVGSTILFKELLGALAAEGRTVFYCSHMMDVVERVCDRIVVLHEGRIVGDGSFEELAGSDRNASLEQVFAELTGTAASKEQSRKLLDAVRR